MRVRLSRFPNYLQSLPPAPNPPTPPLQDSKSISPAQRLLLLASNLGAVRRDLLPSLQEEWGDLLTGSAEAEELVKAMDECKLELQTAEDRVLLDYVDLKQVGVGLGLGGWSRVRALPGAPWQGGRHAWHAVPAGLICATPLTHSIPPPPPLTPVGRVTWTACWARSSSLQTSTGRQRPPPPQFAPLHLRWSTP